MAFTIRLCPYCGADITVDEMGVYNCLACGKATYRSRSNSKAYLINKPYEEEYSQILNLMDNDAKKALDKINEVIVEADEPDADMFFTRGIVYSYTGEEGKAHMDWKKGLDLLTDFRYIDAYIVAVCKRIADLMIMKEREFMEFNPIEYIDAIATEFALKAEVPCKGIFYITIYRNLRMMHQSGELDEDAGLYSNLVKIIVARIIAYGRNYRTVREIIEEVLEDLHYNPETYQEDDNLRLHVFDVLREKLGVLSKDFSDDHITRIFRHWNDENMYELEYWVDELLKPVRNRTLLLKLREMPTESETYELEESIEDYAKKYLVLSSEGHDLSKEA